MNSAETQKQLSKLSTVLSWSDWHIRSLGRGAYSFEYETNTQCNEWVFVPERELVSFINKYYFLFVCSKKSATSASNAFAII